MKLTLSWLKDHLKTEASLEKIVTTLTTIGLEVEGVEDRTAILAPFTVAQVVEAKPHPNADRLRVCIVNTGKEQVQVVCGAPNVRTGLKGVFAPTGSHIPGTGLDLKPGNIRGEASNGMLCSEREMGLSDEHEGIIELPEDAEVGTSFARLSGLDDPVIDIAITPNRGDCLGVRGIARDLAAAGLGTLKEANFSSVRGQFTSPLRWVREEAVGKACPYVAGRFFRGVRNGPSPDWLQKRLRAVGLRPISVLVDITNYITLDLGRPLHVFDVDKLSGDTLTMSLSKTGETLLALDGKDYVLEDGMVVIRDGKCIQGLGGVMGGETSGCAEGTRDVFLEVALFDPIRVAETGRKLNVQSDARYRFERGVDPQSARWGVEVATRLILKLCGGKASEVVSAGTLPEETRTAQLRKHYLQGRSGVEIGLDRAAEILTGLGFRTKKKNDALTVTIPSWRSDVEGEHCLLEEVLRIHGLDAVPAVPLDRNTPLPQLAITAQQRRMALAKKSLALRGMMETVTYSFMAAKDAALFADVPETLHLANPISADLGVMRPSILGNLVQAAVRNVGRGEANVALFEIGPTFQNVTEAGQVLVATGLRVGQTGPRHWATRPRSVDTFDVKADALAVLSACGGPASQIQVTADAPAWYHPGRSGTLRLGPAALAWFGELHPRVTKALSLKGRAVAFELFIEAIPQPKAKKTGRNRGTLQASSLMPLHRDFAFVVDRNIEADSVVKAVAGADKALIADVSVFDLYEGEELSGKKSLALSVTLQPRDKTLTDTEIEAVADKIVANVNKRTGGELRS